MTLEFATKKEVRRQTNQSSISIGGKFASQQLIVEPLVKSKDERYSAKEKENYKTVEKRFPSLLEMVRLWTYTPSSLAYTLWYASQIGLDKIVAYARMPTQEDAHAAIEAMEKCASSYPQASVDAKYFIKDYFVLAAMIVAREHFKEKNMNNYYERATAAINALSNGEGLYSMEDLETVREKVMRSIMRLAPQERF